MDDPTSQPWPLDDPEDPTSERRRVPWLLLVGLVPWLVLGLVLTRPSGRAAPVAPGASPTSASTETSAAAEPERAARATAPAGASGPAATVLAAPSPDVTTASEVAAVAVVVARAHLSGVGPRLAEIEATPPADRYVEHAMVEAVDHPGPGAAVATVLAVVLTVEDGDYGSVELVRLAVPLSVDDAGVAPAGAPWPLPPRELTPRALTVGDPIEDPVLLTEAGAALTRAGFAVEAVEELTTTASWPLVATVRAVAPGEITTRQHTVWLRTDLGDLVVAGSRTHREEQP